MSCPVADSRVALAEFPRRAVCLDVSEADEPELRVVLSELRAAQRCIEGLVMRVGARSNALASRGLAAPAAEAMRADGVVGARQARKEAARVDAAETVPGLGDAVAAGEVSGEHVDAIARHATSLTDEQRAAVDFGSLVRRAGDMPPETFGRLVKRVVDRATADHGLADTLAKQNASEFRHWFDDKTGMGRFSGSLDPERYEALTNAIDQRTASLAAVGGVTKNRNLAAQALVELVTSAGVDRSAGDRRPSVLVVVDDETLTNGPHPRSIRQTESGHDIAAESVARLCCDAVIRRVTMDDHGVPIAVGRKHRTATDGQWAALKAMHSSCGWDGCTAPIGWCQAHHIKPWEGGGVTDLVNLVPLCPAHHHRVHEGGWHIRLEPDRRLVIRKPDGTHHTTVPTPSRC